MKHLFWRGVAAAMLAGTFMGAQGQVPALVTADRVNVRSRPSVLSGEVITQLARGQQVIVFEEGLPASDPKEPVSDWTRIELPAGTPVWVSSDYLEVPAGTVRVPRLNVRAGPSEDYGVLGTVSEGMALRSLEAQDAWLKVQAPLGLSGFVASSFLQVSAELTTNLADRGGTLLRLQAPSQPPAGTAATPVPLAEDASPAPVTSTPPASAPATSLPPESPALTGFPAPQETDVPTPEPSPDTLSGAGDQTVEPAEPSVELSVPGGLAVTEISPVPRIVRRDGVVRGTFSIQAPTPFQLDAAENGVLLNYLLPRSTNVLIRPFRGLRVRVIGEEFIEPRWPNAPVLVVHEIKLAP